MTFHYSRETYRSGAAAHCSVAVCSGGCYPPFVTHDVLSPLLSRRFPRGWRQGSLSLVTQLASALQTQQTVDQAGEDGVQTEGTRELKEAVELAAAHLSGEHLLDHAMTKQRGHSVVKPQSHHKLTPVLQSFVNAISDLTNCWNCSVGRLMSYPLAECSCMGRTGYPDLATLPDSSMAKFSGVVPK